MNLQANGKKKLTLCIHNLFISLNVFIFNVLLLKILFLYLI